ncbi:MAG: hypothetical protein LLG20_01065 [Acidobacteriales bacterium]|nr:hypothetical protein [Terriglobales bacterium]
MPETLEKLRPDRDLQCYFERPSAIAALSQASATGFRVSGTWRQQFDWAVVEWNRDNVFEHPALRNLPDGDLSGLTLSYEETRNNCMAMDCDLYPTVEWPYLRIWASSNGVEDLYKIKLRDCANPVEGSYTCASTEFELQGTATTGDYVGLAWLEEHHTYQLYASDTLETATQAIVDSVNSFSQTMRATRTGTKIRLTYIGAGQTPENSTTGANGNRIGVYGFVAGAKTEIWTPEWARLSGGTSPTKWRVNLNFGNLTDVNARMVPTQSVRKMRWTYAANFQLGEFARGEFEVLVSNWTVGGERKAYSVAGPGSRRIEDDSHEVTYSGTWQSARGNFSGGSIQNTTTPTSTVQCSYRCPQAHELYLGTRACYNGTQISIRIDGAAASTRNLKVAGEDTLVRIPLGQFTAGEHTVTVAHDGVSGEYFYFDSFEIAIPSLTLPEFDTAPTITLATDWDTDHSIALAAERTAWLLHKLGFHGRANHYVGAMWFYELYRKNHHYASVTVDFAGTPQFSATTTLYIGRTDEPPEKRLVLAHVNKIGDTAQSIARAFELEINRGYIAVRAEADGPRLTVYARAMGAEGNMLKVEGDPVSGQFQVLVSSETLTGGADGEWRTDAQSEHKLNRAVRDWSRCYFEALHGYGIDAAAAFSLELQHGDDSMEAGIAQRHADGSACWLNTPALQTNFSPASVDYWKQVQLEMASVMNEAGVTPFLQLGEVQWWYFPTRWDGVTGQWANAGSMPFYDAYATTTFQNTYNRPMHVFASNEEDPSLYPEEAAFLSSLIGSFTAAAINHVRAVHPNCRFEALYPTDVNQTALNRLVNYPDAEWTPAKLDCLKTESFSYTYARDLNLSHSSMDFGATKGFPRTRRGHLVGIGDHTTAWLKEARLAQSEYLESVVLFALDQYCLIGYATPLPASMRRSMKLG